MMESAGLRYSCQVALPGFGEQAQQRLKNARVLLVGMGGLGCPAAQYLCAAGVGMLGIADFDVVSVSNLHRQILYSPADVGQKKVDVAASRLQSQNPDVKIVCYDVRVSSANVMDLLAGYDMVIDGTDNFDTRYLLNDAAVLTGIPLVYGAIYQYEGQVAVWNMINADGSRTPNYRDLFPQVDASQIPNCADGGVIPTLAGLIGCMQANEAIKYITNTGELLVGKILVFDAQSMQSRVIKIGNTSKTTITALTASLDIPLINAADLKTALASNEFDLIDVRTHQEREAGHIGGIHIPLNEFAGLMPSVNLKKPTVFYCASGKRSAEAVKMILQKIPDAPVFSLDGGLKEFEWGQ